MGSVIIGTFGGDAVERGVVLAALGGLFNPLGDAVVLGAADVALRGATRLRLLGVLIRLGLAGGAGDLRLKGVRALLRVCEGQDRQHQTENEPGPDVGGDLDDEGGSDREPQCDHGGADRRDRPQGGGVQQKGQKDGEHQRLNVTGWMP